MGKSPRSKYIRKRVPRPGSLPPPCVHPFMPKPKLKVDMDFCCRRRPGNQNESTGKSLGKQITNSTTTRRTFWVGNTPPGTRGFGGTLVDGAIDDNGVLLLRLNGEGRHVAGSRGNGRPMDAAQRTKLGGIRGFGTLLLRDLKVIHRARTPSRGGACRLGHLSRR